MGRLVPLLPPLALLLLVVAASVDGIARFDDYASLLRCLPLLVIGVAYVAVGRRKRAP